MHVHTKRMSFSTKSFMSLIDTVSEQNEIPSTGNINRLYWEKKNVRPFWAVGVNDSEYEKKILMPNSSAFIYSCENK